MAHDYKAIGLKVGLEIHAQLDTTKLFCSCGSDLVDTQNASIKRRLRPTMSELGEIDPAAKEEFTKKVMQLYKASLDHACLVYADEEPPHNPNPDAVHILLQIAALLKATIVDQIHFMRKIVIDGSNVSGFQRTALVALDGIAYSEFGTVRIPTVCLEEDAARLIETAGRTKIWNMDRLGTPLVEIATDPSMHHPRQARDIALYLGQAMKATKRLKRGIGTIRQDVNISISGGTRVELKGVQELNLIEDYVTRECTRQLALISLRDELARRGVTTVDPDIIDVSSVFEGTTCKIIKHPVYGIRLDGFAKLPGREVQEGRRFGTELADYAKKYVRGIFHSDELPKYGITQGEVDAVITLLNVGEGDAFVLVTETESVARKALLEVIRRARLALDGVPPETRRPLPDGNSQYMRPLPGKSRMYPETDVYPLRITRERLDEVARTLPELPAETIERLGREYGLTRDNAARILDWDAEELFVFSQNGAKMPQSRFLRMMEMFTKLSREGVEAQSERDDLLRQFISGESDVTTDSYEDVLRIMMEKGVDAKAALLELGIAAVSSDEVRDTVSAILDAQQDMISQKGKDAFKPLMGPVMAALKGKCDGKTISAILREELEKRL